jgi:polyvinyl alcohol dehydrogenase (cytochrome)
MSAWGRRTIAIALCCAVVAAGCADDSEGADDPGTSIGQTSEPSTDAAVPDGCDWPMYGHGPDRTFAYPSDCDTAISPDTAGDLVKAWFFNTEDVVTATPAVVEGSVYVGDWAGVFYALNASTGEERWRFETEPHKTVYSGQIVGSAAVAAVGDQQLVFFPGGKTLYALDTESGDEVWRFDVGVFDDEDDYDLDADVADEDRPTEIQSSPVVVDGKVIVGFDAHDRAGFRAGLVALDAATGDLVWDFDPDQGAEPTGCVGVWGSPSVDLDRGLVFSSTANCPSSPDGWGDYTEALFAVDLGTGEPVWSYQPHPPNTDDTDLPGAPNLFSADDHDLVGIGSKDGRYYAVDRESGELVWEATGKQPDLDGSNFSFGGFIGPAAVGASSAGELTVAGGTAGNGATACPCLHAFAAGTGDVVWQAAEPQPIYGASAIANGVLFSGGTDFTFRAVDLASGDVLWSTDMPGVVAGGSAIVGDDVFAVAGIREPGTDVTAQSAGVFRFTLDAGSVTTTEPPSSTSTPDYDGPITLSSAPQDCVGTPCDIRFSIVPPPDGLNPTGNLVVQLDPFSVHMEVTGMGDPDQWVAPNAPDADAGADEFALMISVSDENPVGARVCTFEPLEGSADTLVCDGDTIPLLAPQYNRLSILALPAGAPFPSIAEGVARLVWTDNFDPVLTLVDPPPPEETPP